ncbi:Os06g0617100 [Oryza sativa Japonica Group]|uniref:Os06g0617100 protein n=2 Tax=Oryza TaxID=4527 RepID=A0A0P0WYQ6_ORYSJ|nr:Os06g0617100 [Oryza sativa Japonica Group]
MHELLPDAVTDPAPTWSSRCWHSTPPVPFCEALRWVVRRRGGQTGGWSEVACAVVDRQWYAPPCSTACSATRASAPGHRHHQRNP